MAEPQSSDDTREERLESTFDPVGGELPGARGTGDVIARMSGRSSLHVGWHTLVLAALSVLLTCAAAAESPPNARTQGWRETNDPAHAGYAGRGWRRDFGVLTGHCDTAAVLGVVGTVGGAAVGSRSDDRATGVIIGATIGAVIGATIGRELDRTDRACIGHALELAAAGRVVAWTNNTTRVHYTLTLVRNVDRRCRQFRLVGRRGGKDEVTTQIACSSGDGRWQPR